MTMTATRRRPAVATRRAGYIVAVLVNAAMLCAVNVWPGWEAVPFLTQGMRLVIGLVNLSIVVNLGANVVYVLRDPPWVKALGDMLTTTVGLVALARIWQIFPFDFGGSSFDWTLVARVLLGVGIIGSAIGIGVAAVSLGKGLAAR